MNYNQYRNSTTAIISLIAGITGLTVFPVFGSIIAVITGHMAKKEIRMSGYQVGGNGLATFGLILGYIGLAGLLCGICLFLLIFVFGVISVPFAMDDYYLIAPLLY